MTDRDDLDALVTRLNAGVPAERRTSHERPPDDSEDAQTARLRRWLEEVVERSGSDLLLVAGAPPSIRIDGVVTPFDEAPLGSEEIEDAIEPALPPHAQRQYHETGIADGSFRTRDIGRFRINLHHERGRSAAAIRRLPSAAPRFAALNLPPNIEALTRLPRGTSVNAKLRFTPCSAIRTWPSGTKSKRQSLTRAPPIGLNNSRTRVSSNSSRLSSRMVMVNVLFVASPSGQSSWPVPLMM